MRILDILPVASTLFAVSLHTLPARAGFVLTYCATVNTATGPSSPSIYQTNGLCHDVCVGQGAKFAVLLDADCWCTNDAPARSDRVDLSKCNHECKGFPSEKCGGNNLYGYLQLEDRSTLPSSTSAIATATVTAEGTVKTVLVTPTIDPATGATSSAAVTTGSQPGLSTGAIVGIVVVIIALVAALGAGIWFWLRRKKRRESVRSDGTPGTVGTMTPTMTEAGAGWETDQQGKRRSRMIPADPRMDTFATGIYQRDESVPTRLSDESLRDDLDYSRRVVQPKVLRATNPDPTDD